MATNFYGRLIGSTEKIEGLDGLVHVGWQNAGQKFLFNANGLNFDTMEDYKKWLSQFEIRSQHYDTVFSNEDFWEGVEECQAEEKSVEYGQLEGYEFFNYSSIC